MVNEANNQMIFSSRDYEEKTNDSNNEVKNDLQVITNQLESGIKVSTKFLDELEDKIREDIFNRTM